MKITKFFSLMLAVAMFAVGCEKTPNSGEPKPNVPEASGAITLTTNASAIELGESITFTILQEGQDVTAAATIYITSTYTPVENPYTPETTGTFSIYATKGKESSEIVVVTVMASVPELTEDIFPESTAFNHRVLFVDHTGTSCGNCPRVMEGLKAMAETDIHESYSEVCVHGGSFAPASSDKAYSDAAKVVDQFYKPNGYPNIRFNFYDGQGNIGSKTEFVRENTKAIQNLLNPDGAEAGISIATSGDSSSVYVAYAVKARVAQEYRVTAWLLENNINNPAQSGTSNPEFKIHHHALRNIAGNYSRNDLSGDSIGELAAGETKEGTFKIDVISNKWVVENMEVLFIVSAQNEQGRFEVVNTAVCPINTAVGFEYL